jgi:G3E family GTPase
MKLDKIVTVLDADFWEARENFGPLFYRQLETANLILLNKVDLVPSTDVPHYLEEIHDVFPGCQVIPTVRCNIDPSTLWSPTTPKGAMLMPMKLFSDKDSANDGHGSHKEEASTGKGTQFVTFSFTETQQLIEECFNQFAEALPPEVFRMKGPVRLTNRSIMINHVGGKSEILAWPDVGQTTLAFIGWNIDKEKILSRLRKCIFES